MVSRSPTRRRSRSSRCKKLLRKNIATEISAYRRGRFASPKQAVAVAYALTRKRCGKSWGRKRKSRRSKKNRC